MTTDRDLTWDEFEQRLVASGWTKEAAHDLATEALKWFPTSDKERS